MKILHIILLSILVNITAFGAPAITREIVFTQPDGTQFSGKLKGDSSFHWIESNGDVIIYNPKDKYYYKAIVDSKKGLLISNEKVIPKSSKVNGLSLAKSREKSISKTEREKLKLLYKKAKHSDGPR
jgi:hypothetical protein